MEKETDIKVWYDDDIHSKTLRDKSICVIGYGAQGRSHALNLRDSGMKVMIGQRPGAGFDRAVEDGFQPVPITEAVAASDLIALMLPDEIHGDVFDQHIRDALKPGAVLLVCHGFSLLYLLVKPPEGVATVLVAPKGAGHRVRSAYEEGSGVPCLVALGPQANEADHLPIALEYAKAIGGGRAGVLRTTVREETETDLFGEQAVLCGGVSHLCADAFNTLVEAGYQPEIAWFECIHELKLVVDLIHRGGLAYMRDHISNTAEYGDYTRGPRIIDDHVRESMKSILKDIRNGTFAREWIAETQSGGAEMNRYRTSHRDSLAERTGQRLHQILKRHR